MNIGLMLRKQGESRLGLFIRLMLSNRGYLKLGSAPVRELLDDVLIKNKNLKDFHVDIELNGAELLIKTLNRLEYERGAECSKLYGEMYWSKNVRNCSTCAKLGYHSGYFGAEWLTKCPIHKKPLTRRCPKCLKLWPGFSQLGMRKCSICGVRTSYDELLKRGAFEVEKFYLTFSKFEQYFENKHCEIEDNILGYNLRWGKFQCIAVHGHHSYAYPSFVAAYKALTKKEKLGLIECGVPLYEIKQYQFTLGSNNERLLTFGSASEIIKEVRNKVLFRAESQLMSIKRLNHQFRSCFSCSSDLGGGCASCSTYEIIKNSLRAQIFFRRNELFRYHVYGTYRHVIREPSIINMIGADNSKCVLTDEVMALLYETELWTQIRILYYKLSRAELKSTPPANMTALEWSYKNSRIAKVLDSYTFPFFFTREREGSKAQLFIPKTFLSPEIEIDQAFIDLYFPRETKWVQEV